VVMVASDYRSCFRCSLRGSSADIPVKCKAVGVGIICSLVGNRESGGNWEYKYGVRGLQGRSELVCTRSGQGSLRKKQGMCRLGQPTGSSGKGREKETCASSLGIGGGGGSWEVRQGPERACEGCWNKCEGGMERFKDLLWGGTGIAGGGNGIDHL